MKVCRLMGFSMLLPALLVSAANAQDFESVNAIVSRLNPLEVFANEGGVRRSIDLNIRFSLGSAQLLPAARLQLEALAKALLSSRLAGFDIRLIGHTDATGDAASNQRLSALRAAAVKQSLVTDYQIEEQRLNTEGKGETALLKGLAATDPKHRRVEIVAVASSEANAASSVNAPSGVTKQNHEQVLDAEGEQIINW